MPFKTSGTFKKPQVRFPTSRASAVNKQKREVRPSDKLGSSNKSKIEQDAQLNMEFQQQNLNQSERLPSWLTDDSETEDDFPTESSELLLDTAQECLPFLLGIEQIAPYSKFSVPPLIRERHLRFLKQALGRLPAPFVGLDASRPWMFYWGLTALSSLGEDLSQYRDRLIKSLKPIQNATGGFGGGHGQYSHLATTYATVLSLATVGGPEAFDLIDRKSMWHWLGRLKQPGGEFEVCQGGEVDVRGALCAMVMVTLLNLPLELPEDSPARVNGGETLVTRLAEWISECQAFDGGLGSIPGAEAHGAYTFCGLACLCLLGDPGDMLTRYLDFPALLRWLTARQHSPEGGLAGRTNKLVDGCYSHWIGGCWSLMEAAARNTERGEVNAFLDSHGLFNREALIRYILCCGQSEKGGLRDKPSKPADAYHTQYCLAGLSAAQNFYSHFPDAQCEIPHNLPAGFKWTASRHRHQQPNEQLEEHKIFSENDRVSLIHPIYVIPFEAPGAIIAYFADKPIDINGPEAI